MVRITRHLGDEDVRRSKKTLRGSVKAIIHIPSSAMPCDVRVHSISAGIRNRAYNMENVTHLFLLSLLFLAYGMLQPNLRPHRLSRTKLTLLSALP